MKLRILLILAIGLCIANCSTSNTPVPTLVPTDKPEIPTTAPTQTPEPTPTQKPTQTPIPKPTTTNVPTPLPTQMVILEGKWESNNQTGIDNVYLVFYPDGTFEIESVEEGKFHSQGIFWFDEAYMYFVELTGIYCQGVGQYEVKLSGKDTLVFLGWIDDCDVRWMTMTTSTWDRR